MANEVRAEAATESSSTAKSAIARVSAAVFPYSYHEIATDKHVVQINPRLDVLEQLKGNIAQLEDLHGRMRFMMKEVRGLLKR